MASLFQCLPVRQVLLAGPHAYKRPRPTTTPLLPRQQSRIASWDTKRETCHNCKRIFLKCTSRVAGFCSLDCQSSAVYRTTIRRRNHELTQPLELPVASLIVDDEPLCVVTFAAFGLEERMETDFGSVRETASSLVPYSN